MARFGSPDEREDVSVSIRGANTLKLTFLQIKDVTEFGDVNEAAPLFVPPGARLVSATARVSPAGQPGGDNVDKSYYTYDFEFGVARVLLTVAVEQGNAYLLGCTASGDAWERAEAGFRRAAASFRVGAEPNKADQTRPDAGAAAEVTLPRNGGAPAESMNCKGPLPIFCSVETNDE